MATIKKGTLVSAPQWWRHLRSWKRVFWKSERQAARRDIGLRAAESFRQWQKDQSPS